MKTVKLDAMYCPHCGSHEYRDKLHLHKERVRHYRCDRCGQRWKWNEEASTISYVGKDAHKTTVKVEWT